MTKHTPGPWERFGVTEDYEYGSHYIPVKNGDGIQVAMVDVYNPGIQEAEMNADLIAAAPQLLLALEQMVLLVNDILKSNASGSLIVQNYNRLADAPVLSSQALAKANGVAA